MRLQKELAFRPQIRREGPAPAELPLGIITALLGAPFFLSLLMRVRRQGGF